MNRHALLASSASGLLLPRHALGEADTRRLVMNCDHPGCRNVPDRAPRIVIPSATPFALGHKPIKVMTTLHFCLPHQEGSFQPATWLTAHNKSRVEEVARARRPRGFRPDFEAATVEMLLVTTPEYHDYLKAMGINQRFTAA